MPDLRYCIIVLLVCFCLMNGENPEPKRRKYRVGTKTKATASKMAAQSGKNTCQDKKDSPSVAKPSKPGAPSSFPADSRFLGLQRIFPLIHGKMIRTLDLTISLRNSRKLNPTKIHSWFVLGTLRIS